MPHVEDAQAELTLKQNILRGWDNPILNADFTGSARNTFIGSITNANLLDQTRINAQLRVKEAQEALIQAKIEEEPFQEILPGEIIIEQEIPVTNNTIRNALILGGALLLIL